MLEQIPAIIYTDSVGEFSRTVYINPQVESITGYTPRQWLADRELWFTIIHEEDQDRIRSESIRTEDTGEPYKVEYRIWTRDGQMKWLYSEAWLLHDAAGKPLFWQGFMIDITERKQAEMELEHRAAELSALQETVLNLTMRHSLPDLLNLIVERATRLLNANGGGLYLVENDAETIKCVVSYNTHHNYAGTILKYGEGAAGKVVSSKKPLIIKSYSTWSGKVNCNETDEPPFRALVSAPMIWQGNVNGVLNVFREDQFSQRDMDQLILFANHAAVAVENARLYESAAVELEERKRAETALRESIVIYRQAIESTGGVPYYQSYGVDGKSIHYDFIGEGIQQITGYGPQEFTEELWNSLVLEAHVVGELAKYPWDEAVRRVRLGENPGTSWKCEYRIRAQDGKIPLGVRFCCAITKWEWRLARIDRALPRHY